MTNHQAIRDNVRTGDILLSRKANGPMIETVDGVTRSKWNWSFLYIGDNKVLSRCRIRPLELYLNKDFSVGLFRIKPILEEEKQPKLVKVARKTLGVRHKWFLRLWYFVLRILGGKEDRDWSIQADSGMLCSEAIATAYNEVGRPVKTIAPSKMQPVDFDDSNVTVRIA